MDSECTLPTQQVNHQSVEFRRQDESTLEVCVHALNLLPTQKSTNTSSIADKKPQDSQSA